MSGNETPQPFDPQRVTPGLAGCGKPMVIGCAGLLVVLAIGLGVAVMNMDRLVSWTFDTQEDQVMARLSPETSSEDVRRIREGFGAVKEAILAGQMDPAELNRLMGVVQGFVGGKQRPDQEDVDHLIEMLESTAEGPKASEPIFEGAVPVP